MSTYVSRIAGPVDFTFPYDPSHQWDVVGGYAAPIQAWLVPAEIAQGVMDGLGASTGADREVTLEMGDVDAPLQAFRVITLGITASDNPQRVHLLFTDVRWYFTRAWFLLDVNVRRRIGDKRVVGTGLVTELSVADEIAYAEWTINDGAAYTWDALKNQVLGYLTTASHGRPELFWVTDDFSIDIPAEAVTEQTTDALATVGLARAIESVPGAGIYVALDGTIHVYDRTPGAEKDLVEALPKALKGHGSLVWVDNAGIRSPKWWVHVDYEIELRCDYNFSTTEEADPDGLLADALAFTGLTPVLQVTDKTLTVPMGAWGASRVVGQGTWLPMVQAFEAWGTKTIGSNGVSYTLPKLTLALVARYWFSGYLDQYSIGGSSGLDPIWASRIAQVKKCFRTYFQIHPPTWARIRRAWTVRAAVWDPTTGTRAPSPVYCNYSYTPVDNFDPALVREFGQNVDDCLTETGILTDGRPSGFELEFADQELGIVFVDRGVVMPAGQDDIAVSDVVNLASLEGINGSVFELAAQELEPDWSLATIISCSPGAPNDLRRLYPIEVSIADAADRAGLSYTPTAYGPDQEDRSHIAQGRIAWSDDDPTPTQIVLKLVGAADTPDIDRTDETDSAPSELEPINLAQELVPIGEAVAAAALMSRLDHYEGSQAVPANAGLVPIGSIDRVTHRVTKNRFVSVVHCTPVAPVFHAIDFLHGSERNFLLKEIASAR